MIRSLILMLTLWTALPTICHATPADTPAHIATHTRIPTLQSIAQTFSDAWNWVTSLFSNLFSKLVIRNVPSVLKELYATRVAREKGYAQTYITQGIPDDIATIAGTLDRMEEDFRTCRTALSSERDPSSERSLLQELDRIDDEVDDYMDRVQPLIEKYEEKAFSKRNSQLFKFLQVLQSRAFVVEMLKQ